MWSKSTGSLDDATCTQWRLNPTTDVLQYRSWTSGSTPSPTPPWTTVDTGVSTTQHPPAVLAARADGHTAPTMQYQVLSINFITKRDKGNLTTPRGHVAHRSEHA